MKKVKNWLNAHEFPKEYETNNLPSLTVPDQTMSIREIMDRFARGLPLDVRVPIYEGEESEFPDVNRLDLAEIQELTEQSRDERDYIINKFNIEQNAKETKLKKQNEKPLPVVPNQLTGKPDLPEKPGGTPDDRFTV